MPKGVLSYLDKRDVMLSLDGVWLGPLLPGVRGVHCQLIHPYRTNNRIYIGKVRKSKTVDDGWMGAFQDHFIK